MSLHYFSNHEVLLEQLAFLWWFGQVGVAKLGQQLSLKNCRKRKEQVDGKTEMHSQTDMKKRERHFCDLRLPRKN